MTALVLGANGSGKSAYAEKRAAKLSAGNLYYIATMIPYGPKGLQKVNKHIQQRAPFGFITIEQPSNISEIPIPADTTILLEDVSNLLGNTLFDGGSAEGVFADIKTVCDCCANAVMVSIGGLVDQPEYDEQTRDYIDALNQLNQRLIDFADTVIIMRKGKPILMKGAENALD